MKLNFYHKTFLVLILLYLPLNALASKRIVGGEKVLDQLLIPSAADATTIDQWPWVVAITDGHAPFCGASLIASSWLLTAAHCLYDPSTAKVDPNLIMQAVFLQSDLFQHSEQRFSRTITEYHIHPDYNYDLDLNDLAVLKLDAAVDTIMPVSLPGSSFDAFTVASGTMSTVLGWGTTQDNQDRDLMLRKVEVPVTEQNLCAESLAKNDISLQNTMVCAGYVEGGKDACTGDSGGPLVYFSEPLQNWVQIGLVSFGIGCALPGEYGIYTRLSKFTQVDQFINSNICESLPETPNVQVQQNGNQISFNFSTSQNDSTYRIYYAPYPAQTPIHYIDVLSNSFSVSLAPHESYSVAVQTRQQNCVSHFSNIMNVNL